MRGEIRTESFLWEEDTLTSVSSLSPDQREALACWLKETYLNELCRGRAIFTPAKDAGTCPKTKPARPQ